jgi:hypothetical protein
MGWTLLFLLAGATESMAGTDIDMDTVEDSAGAAGEIDEGLYSRQ